METASTCVMLCCKSFLFFLVDSLKIKKILSIYFLLILNKDFTYVWWSQHMIMNCLVLPSNVWFYLKLLTSNRITKSIYLLKYKI